MNENHQNYLEVLKPLDNKYNQLRLKFNLLIGVLLVLVAFVAFKERTEKTITVERINIVEPDGKLRMVLSNRATSPGNLHYGKEFIKGGNRSGMIFYNDEETESGGLIFDGKTDSVTKQTTAAGHLSFDQYNQNQVIYLSYSEEGGKKEMGLNIDEWQNKPSFKEWREQIAQIYTKSNDTAVQRKMYQDLLYPGKNKRAYSKRAFLGRDEDENAALVLYDKLNRKRLIVHVDSSGLPSIQFLNEKGKIIKIINEK